MFQKLKNYYIDVIFPLFSEEFYEDIDLKHSSKIHRMKKMWGGLWSNRRLAVEVLLRKKLIIPYAEIVLTTFCSLRCRDCANLIQYYTGDHKHAYHTDLGMNVRSLKRLLLASDQIKVLSLLGGEPLLYPELKAMLQFVSEQDKVHRCQIVTNGTIAKIDDGIIDILSAHSDKFLFVISNYGDKSKHKDELIELFDMHGIRYEVRFNDDKWIDYGGVEHRGRDASTLKKQYLRCNSSCRSILNGKLHQCPRSSNGMDLGIVPDNPNDYIDLLDDEIEIRIIRTRLMDFYRRKEKCITACDYCDNGVNDEKYVEPGIQV